MLTIRRAIAHIVTTEALDMGDPEIIITAGPGEIATATELDRAPIGRDRDGYLEIEATLAALGWRPVGDRTPVAPGYHTVAVEPAP